MPGKKDNSSERTLDSWLFRLANKPDSARRMSNIRIGCFALGVGVSAIALSIVAVLSPSLNVVVLAGVGVGLALVGLALVERGERDL